MQQAGCFSKVLHTESPVWKVACCGIPYMGQPPNDNNSREGDHSSGWRVASHRNTTREFGGQWTFFILHRLMYVQKFIEADVPKCQFYHMTVGKMQCYFSPLETKVISDDNGVPSQNCAEHTRDPLPYSQVQRVIHY